MNSCFIFLWLFIYVYFLYIFLFTGMYIQTCITFNQCFSSKGRTAWDSYLLLTLLNSWIFSLFHFWNYNVITSFPFSFPPEPPIHYSSLSFKFIASFFINWLLYTRVCVYVCMFICSYVCMFVCMYVCCLHIYILCRDLWMCGCLSVWKSGFYSQVLL